MASAQFGGAADLRIENDDLVNNDYANRELSTLHDPSVTIEEYIYYAKLSRAYEATLSTKDQGYSKLLHPKYMSFKGMRGRNNQEQEREVQDEKSQTQIVEKTTSQPSSGTESPSSGDRKAVSNAYPTDQEWFHASRALRTATWGATFYLITTDILGPFSVPWSLTQLGWAPGTVLYTVFGAMAGYGGWLLWQSFLNLDSDRYPVKVYGDLAYRIFGNWARITCNALQSLQFFLNVALLILTYGQSISELSKGKVCFVVCLLIFTIAGCLLGQVRTLQRFSYIANWAFWLNVVVILFTMGVIPSIGPNRKAVNATYNLPINGKITHSVGLPPQYGLEKNIVGLMQAVFSYGGATLFCELMAEMRRPWDFWKGLLVADTVIYIIYIVYGLFVYNYYGNYAFNPSFQGIGDYKWATAANAIGVVSALIAAALYGNIGIKILYVSVGEELLNAPGLRTRMGKILWAILVPVYWLLAFTIGSAIPQLSNFQGLVGAACILQFTYTFPPILMVGLNIQKDAMTAEEEFNPATGVVKRVDAGFKRHWRGFKRQMPRNLWDMLFALGAAVTAILGIYSSVKLIIQGYEQTAAFTSFSCISPTG